jgi:hypothetical protein
MKRDGARVAPLCSGLPGTRATASTLPELGPFIWVGGNHNEALSSGAFVFLICIGQTYMLPRFKDSARNADAAERIYSAPGGVAPPRPSLFFAAG